jgi:exodeoxyribonuclease V alpha subunit
MTKNNKLNEEELLQFVFTPEFCVYMGEEFKVFSGSVSAKDYPQIKTNSYGNVSIAGNIHSLSIGVPHLVTAIEEDGKYGKSYKVHNIIRETPKDSNAIKNFLMEILTPTQGENLYAAYPDIINRIRNNEPVDLSKVKGIGDKSFEKIKKNIMDNFVLVELCEYYHGVFSISIMRKLHEKYASVPLLNAKLKTAPYSILLSLAGCGFRTSDELVLKLEEKGILEFDVPVRESKDRAKACLIYLLQENEGNGHTKMNAKELKELSSKLAPACAHHFVDLLMNDEHIYFHKATMDVSLIWTYRTEEYIAKRLKEGLKCKDIWNINCSKYVVDDNGITLTEEQSSVLSTICNNQIVLLEGAAGCGKSASAYAIIKMLKDNYKSFLLTSPTGRASVVLAEYTKEKTFTIHRGLGYIHPNQWTYNVDNKLPYDVVVVDEFGMVDIFLLKRLLEAIDFNKTKLLIIGDASQLSSVGAGSCLHDIIKSKLIPSVHLTKVFRFGKGGQMTIATKTRLSEKFIDSNETNIMQYGDDKSYVFIPLPQEQMLFKMTQLYDKLLKDGYKAKDIFVLTSYNVGAYGTVELNKLLQPLANDIKKKKYYKYGETMYYEDDLVMQCANNYRSKIYNIDWDMPTEDETLITNGDIGVIYKILDKGIVIKFDKDYIYYTNSSLKDLKLGYSVSITKSQGGSSKIVIMITPKSHTFMLDSNLMYVAQTRAKEKVYHFGEPNVVNRAIKKKANLDRNTYLLELLCK